MMGEEQERASRRSVAILSAMALLFAIPVACVTVASVTAPKSPMPSIRETNVTIVGVDPQAPPFVKSAQEARERHRTIFELTR
jgi:hypothetical protein